MRWWRGRRKRREGKLLVKLLRRYIELQYPTRGITTDTPGITNVHAHHWKTQRGKR